MDQAARTTRNIKRVQDFERFAILSTRFLSVIVGLIFVYFVIKGIMGDSNKLILITSGLSFSSLLLSRYFLYDITNSYIRYVRSRQQ